jgi:hypothetical protein
MAADIKTHMVAFAIKDKSKFNMEQLKEALKEQGYSEVELISGPDTSGAEKKP